MTLSHSHTTSSDPTTPGTQDQRGAGKQGVDGGATKPRRFRMAAHAFVIWRTGLAEGWDISIADIARATGIDRGTVRKIVRAKGWPVSDGRGDNGLGGLGRHSGFLPVDTVMSRPDLAQAMVGVEA